MKSLRFVLLSAICVVIALQSIGCGGSSQSSQIVGKLQVVKGSAVLIHDSNEAVVKPGENPAVLVGDTVRTGAGSEAVVLAAGQVHMLAEKSELRFERPHESGSGASYVNLLQGLATFLFPHTPNKKTQFEAVSNSVVAAVKGTIFRMEHTSDGAQVTVLRGEVEVHCENAAAGAAPVLTKASEQAVARDGKVTVSPASAEDMTKLRTEIILKKALLGADIATY